MKIYGVEEGQVVADGVHKRKGDNLSRVELLKVWLPDALLKATNGAGLFTENRR